MYPNAMIKQEKTTKINSKIAILNGSDYGYASDLSLCKQPLYNYGNSTCAVNNWMVNIFNGNDIGLLNGFNSNSNDTYYTYITENAINNSNSAMYGFCISFPIIPVLYLVSTTGVDLTTDGSINNPYKLIIS